MQVLDAPGLMDDYYSNLIDWSQQDLLAVALADSLYVYNTVTCKVCDPSLQHVKDRLLVNRQHQFHVL